MSNQEFDQYWQRALQRSYRVINHGALTAQWEVEGEDEDEAHEPEWCESGKKLRDFAEQKIVAPLRRDEPTKAEIKWAKLQLSERYFSFWQVATRPHRSNRTHPCIHEAWVEGMEAITNIELGLPPDEFPQPVTPALEASATEKEAEKRQLAKEVAMQLLTEEIGIPIGETDE